ncbi:unnamed protein product [Mycena citricolor]|uniref:Uncharacterized protein n=1 Tax=Mycena citricolor TaxID=2018698 RepID=A0AAD2HKE7_9AGAR|nr:unnamed protein product [Mycena citricolor]
MLSFVLLLPFASLVTAANNWAVPCVGGTCSYDLPATNSSQASGTVTVWSSNTDAISDITTAANWEILGCDPHATSQNIRIVCNTDASSAHCGHLFSGAGAVHKIIRLPESCGGNAFARISKVSVAKNQNIPRHIASRIVRRGSTKQQVHAISFDTNFAAVDHSKSGNVNIAIQGANFPGAASATPLSPPSRRDSRLAQRGLFSSIKQSVSSILHNSVSANKNFNLPPINFNKDVVLLDKSVKCGPVTASLKADLNANAHATAGVVVAAHGTILPPKLTDFSVIATLNGNVQGTLDLTADVTGTIDSGKLPLVNIGIPGFDLPGILTVGPSFQVDAELTAAFDVQTDLNVGINLNVVNAQLAFPAGSSAAPGGNSLSLGDTPLTLSASPSVKATGSATAHLIPSLNLGVSALNGIASAEVFLAMDANAALKLSLEATASAKASTALTAQATGKKAREHQELSEIDERAATADFGGCFEVDAGIDVNVGATGSFFGLFKQNVQSSLFHKSFVILKKCFGSSAVQRRSLYAISQLTASMAERDLGLDRRAGLSCASSSAKTPAPLSSGTVKAAAIKAA